MSPQVSVLARLIRAGVPERRARWWITRGWVRADDRILDDPDEPAPAVIVIAPPAPHHHQETAA